MRWLALLLLASLTAEAQRSDPHGRFDRFCRQRSDRGFQCDDLAFFEAFPASGAGTSGACSTTPPTSAQGSALTFTRASNGTCTKTASGGLATTGIANGDLVVLSTNQSRVEYDGAGTLGLLIESARTNNALRSQEFDNVAWVKVGTGVAAPTVTADFAVAPDGTTTAERIQFTALTLTAQQSMVQQNMGSYGGTPVANTVYIKGNGTSGSLDFCTTAPTTCITCSFVAASWTHCFNNPSPTVTGSFSIGNDTVNGSGTTRAAADVLVWGADSSSGGATYATSYIPTTAAAATRATEVATATLSSGVGPSGCIAASMTWPSSAVGTVNVMALGGSGAGNNLALYRKSNTAAGYEIGVTVTEPAVSAMGTTTHRAVLGDAAGTRSAWWDTGSVAAPAASLSGAQTAVHLGVGPSDTVPIDGIISRLQIDPVSTRCTP